MSGKGRQVVQGYSGIAQVLEAVWHVSVSDKTAWRYANRDPDPLPVSAANGRIWAYEDEIRQWASKRIGKRRQHRT